MLIGVPVAFTPGFEPHADAETVPADAVLDADAAGVADDDVLPVGAVLVLELVLELHAARTPRDSAAKAAAAVRVRQWTDLFMCSAFSWLTASHSSSERDRAPPRSAALTQGLAERRRRSLIHK
jgi:hypothetical protein